MTSSALSRRRFLSAAAGLAGIAVAGGATAPLAATARKLAADIDFNGLKAAMSGRLLRPGDSGYDEAARTWNLALSTRRPQAIAQVANQADVVACVQKAAGRGLPFAARSGGHSYAGYSTPDNGVVVDVSALKQVTVRSDNTAVIGAGAQLIDVYAGLAAHNRALPGGTCSTVGIAGLTLGGGIGKLTRPFGLTCDLLKSATIVTADGAVHTVDAQRDADLYWALRGGGGGHAGIVTEFVFATVPAPSPMTFDIVFSSSSTTNVLSAWSSWQASAPDGLTTTLSVGAGSSPSNAIEGTWLGSSTELTNLLNSLVSAVGSSPTTRTTRRRTYLDTMQYYAGCADKPVSACYLQPGGQIPRETFRAGSRMLAGTLSRSQAGQIVSTMRNQRDMVLMFDALGGKVKTLSVSDTVFPHRSAVASVQIYTWNGGNSSGVTAVQNALTPIAGSGSYVNYILPEQTNWGTSFWGGNHSRLKSVVRAYDPNNVFDFPQSVLRS
ncbi:FAD-dependent oxidoreductase [Kribbella deserti]|uniref:FAD-binding protein n=1 Tax=Kribbella deserti TaxID=1926257 RepID=A0ABV6QNS5_9ACTN